MVKLLAGRHSRENSCVRRESCSIILDTWKRFRSARAEYNVGNGQPKLMAVRRRRHNANFTRNTRTIREIIDWKTGGWVMGYFR
jgi:hypothetical protein